MSTDEPFIDPSVRAAIMAETLLAQTLETPVRPRVSVTSDPAAFDSILFGDTGPVPVPSPRHRKRSSFDWFDGLMLGLIGLAILVLIADGLGWLRR